MNNRLYILLLCFCSFTEVIAQSTASVAAQMNGFVGVYQYQSTVFGEKIAAKAEVRKNASGQLEIIFADATGALNDRLPEPLQNGKAFPLFDERVEPSSSQIHLVYTLLGEIKLFDRNNRVNKITRYYLALMPLLAADQKTEVQNLVFYTVDWTAANGTGSKQPLFANVMSKAGSTTQVSNSRFSLTPERLKAAFQRPFLEMKTVSAPIKKVNVSLPLPSANRYVLYLDKVEAMAVDADDCKPFYQQKAEYFFDLSVALFKNNQQVAVYPSLVVAKPGKPSGYGYPINNGLEQLKPFSLTKKEIRITISASEFANYSLWFTGSIAEMKYCPGGDFDFINPVSLLDTQHPQSISFNRLQSGSNVLLLEKEGKKLKLYYHIQPVTD